MIQIAHAQLKLQIVFLEINPFLFRNWPIGKADESLINMLALLYALQGLLQPIQLKLFALAFLEGDARKCFACFGLKPFVVATNEIILSHLQERIGFVVIKEKRIAYLDFQQAIMRPFLLGKHMNIQRVKDLQDTIGLLAKLAFHLVEYILLWSWCCWFVARGENYNEQNYQQQNLFHVPMFFESILPKTP